ncbi:DUF819 family protein [Parahaliea mediterranea]|uniref:DUF819 family protein n=1 Tax=Parahaliea mediterranea TaxID=651086 RepID=A0A939DEM8_9GAMM|nr:DUF819 family protein [Parahaliea mediterranea]MBN7796092.1 DUF819 family protein [Parahaliea mediterranea]
MASIAGLVLICLAGEWLSRRGWGRYLSAPVVIIILSLLASNLGLLSVEAQVGAGVMGYLVPGAIALLLVQANLRSLWQTSRHLLPMFALAAGATLLVGAVAMLALGDDAELRAIAPVFVATYIGGSVNFLAASQSLAESSPNLVAAALAADAIVGVSYLALLAIYGGFVAAPDESEAAAPASAAHKAAPAFGVPLSLLYCVLFAVLAVAAAHGLVAVSGQSSLFYLYLIGIAVAAANLWPGFFSRLSLAPGLGLAGMYLFFAVIGASTQVSALGGLMLGVLGLAAFIVTGHALLFFLIGRLFRQSMPDLLIISNACILGPPTAAAVASSRGWNHLVAPGMLCGVLGYVVANFLILVLLPLVG